MTSNGHPGQTLCATAKARRNGPLADEGRRIQIKGVAAALLLAGGALCGASSFAQEFPPRRQITIVVGFSAGGTIDALARVVAQQLSQRLGQTVVVSNRPGAGGNIAQQLVQQGEPDGATLLLASIGSLAINPLLMKLSYDPQRELAPVSMASVFPNVLVVRPELGVKNLQEFLALAKAKGKEISFASGGSGTASHLAGEMLNQRAGLEMVHVPFQGGNPAMMAVLGGQVSAYYAAPASALPYLEAKKVVALATTGMERWAQLPDVPTVAESGFAGFNAINWYAFVLPGKTAPEIVKRWNAQLVSVLSSPEARSALAHHGLVPKPSTPEELAAFIDSESKSWAKVITERRLHLK